MKKYRLPFAILITTLPWLYLLKGIDFELLSISQELFTIRLAQVVGNTTAIIGVMLFMWQMLLGSRFFISLFTPNVLSVQKIHKWLGINATIAILIHPALILYTYSKPLSWLWEYSFATEFDFHVNAGRNALLLFLIIWVSSSKLVRKRLKYSTWLNIHYLSYPLIAAALFHAQDIGYFLRTEIAVQTLWFTLNGVFIAFILFRIVSALGFVSKKYTLSTKKIHSDITVLTFTPVKQWSTPPQIGQYVYIKHKRLHKAHPYSVLGYNKSTGEITLGVKKLGKHSTYISNISNGDMCFIDGPYGTFTQEGQNSHPKVVIAGGVGITPFVQLLQMYSENAYLIYCNKTRENALYRKDLKEILGSSMIESITREDNITDESNVYSRRIDVDMVTRSIPQTVVQSANWFICGSPAFIDSVDAILTQMNIDSNRIFTEEFSL